MVRGGDTLQRVDDIMLWLDFVGGLATHSQSGNPPIMH